MGPFRAARDEPTNVMIERKDEIGGMANAVEEFKVLSAEKARQETYEAVRRQKAEAEARERQAKRRRVKGGRIGGGAWGLGIAMPAVSAEKALAAVN